MISWIKYFSKVGENCYKRVIVINMRLLEYIYSRPRVFAVAKLFDHFRWWAIIVELDVDVEQYGAENQPFCDLIAITKDAINIEII